MTKKILVIGGTGMLGYPVARQLKADGFNVVIFTRNIKRARLVLEENFEFAEGDIFDSNSLVSAMKDVEGVHINLQGGPKMKDYDRIENQGTLKIVLAAKESNVKYITLISGTSVKEENAWFPITKAKLSAENYVKNSGIKYTIFRSSWFMESLPLFVRGNKASVVGSNPNAYHWIAANDYAQMVSETYRANKAVNKTLYVYGPEKLTMLEALQIYCKEKHPNITPSVVSTNTIKMIGTISFNAKLKTMARFFNYFEQISENGDAKETEIIFGETRTKIADWIKKI